MAVTKTNKANDTRKKAEALKTKKKQLRDAKASASLNNTKPGKKGPSIVSQSKNKKK